MLAALRNWAARVFTPRRPPRPRAQARPLLEALEDRQLLAVRLGVLTYHGNYFGNPSTNDNSRLLQNVEVVPVYYGPYWSTAAGVARRQQTDAFLKYLVNSSYMDMLHEYSTGASHVADLAQHAVNAVENDLTSVLHSAFGFGLVAGNAGTQSFTTGYTIGRGTVAGDVLVTGPTAPANGAFITQTQLENMLIGQINTRQVTTNADTLLVAFMPPGAVESAGGTTFSSANGSTNGYHGVVGNNLGNGDAAITVPTPRYVPYAAIPTANDNTWFDSVTFLVSHELAEAVTDPTPVTVNGVRQGGWYADHPSAINPLITDPSDNEVADIAETRYGNHLYRLNGYLVSGIWSNDQSRVIGPAGSTVDGGTSLALTAPGTLSLTAPPPVTLGTGSSVVLNNGESFSVSASYNADGSITGTFSGRGLPASGLGTGGGDVWQSPDHVQLMTVSYNEPGDGTVSGSFTITSAGVAAGFAPPNVGSLDGYLGDAPLVAVNVNPVTVTAGAAGGNRVLATFGDRDFSGKPSSYVATIDWGDGTTSQASLASGTIWATGTGMYAVAGNHTYAAPGAYAIQIRVSDPGGSDVLLQSSATVVAPPVLPPPPRPVVAVLHHARIKHRKRLVVDVYYADTGARKLEVVSPYQAPRYSRIRLSTRDTNGDGVVDLVVLTARKGKRTVTASFAV